MTKKELKKEAEEKASIYFDKLHKDNSNVSDTPFSAYDVFVAYEKGALEFAEPREKQIQIDAEQIRALQKQNGELTDKCNKLEAENDDIYDALNTQSLRMSELEAQIEKMKCCANCKKYWRMCEYGDREMQICEKWEITEK